MTQALQKHLMEVTHGRLTKAWVFLKEKKEEEKKKKKAQTNFMH